jgi:CheY-like chemotaxis protein
MARILVVDDDKLVRMVIVKALRGAGHEVVESSDGGEALAALDRDRIDLVVTDILMPGREGIETIREIRKLSPELPVLAMSGGGNKQWNDVLRMASTFGATETIAKPFMPRDLLSAVARLLDACVTSGPR